MTLDPGVRRELDELIHALCEDALDASGEARLTELLGGDPAALDQYLLAMELHASLIWDYALRPGAAKTAVDIDPGGGAWASVTELAAGEHSPSPLMGEGRGEGLSAKSAPPKSPVLGFLGGVVDYVSQSRSVLFWLIFGSLGLYFAAQLGSLMLSRFWAQNAAQLADEHGVRIGTEKKPAEEPSTPDDNDGQVVAWLTRAVDCKWRPATSSAGGAESPERFELETGTEFSAGEKLDLATGLAELTFDSGAKVILHAPARFTVDSALAGDLQLGKLTAKVPHTAKGFTVNTPSGKVVDLGTEFGVKVNFDRTMHVIVYVGSVEVKSTSSGAGDTSPPPVTVKAGQAIVVNPGQPAKPTPPQDERFIRNLEPLGDKQDAEAAYVELVKKLKPAVWYRMEGADADRVLHDAAGGPDAKLTWDGPGNPFVKGIIGKALWLRGEKLKDYAITADYPKSTNGRLTVCAWAYAESRPGYATVAANWRERVGGGQFHLGLWSDENGQSFDLGVKLTQKDGSTFNLREGKKHLFPLYQWQHVAFTSDGKRVKLYRQGKQVASKKQNGFTYPGEVKSLGVGVTFNEAGDAPGPHNPGWWDGKIDEVLIFNDCLSGGDIEKLAGAAPR